MQPRLQAGTAHPVRLQDASLAGASGLHPAQGRRALFSVVGGKHEVPQSQHGDRTGHVNQQKASHNASLMLMVRPRLRRSKGTMAPIHAFQKPASNYLWKTVTNIMSS